MILFNYKMQKGAALFVALVFLLILTLLGLTSSNVSLMQERMAANVAEYNMAFQRAEGVLQEIGFRLQEDLPVTRIRWEQLPSPVLNSADCSLDTSFAGTWDQLGGGLEWRNAPGGLGQYAVVDLAPVADASFPGGMLRPCGVLSMDDGLPSTEDAYLILALGFGPGPPNRQARALVQAVWVKEPI